eukprot:1189562-Prorocentrum_minimum.AAC.1
MSYLRRRVDLQALHVFAIRYSPAGEDRSRVESRRVASNRVASRRPSRRTCYIDVHNYYICNLYMCDE